MLPTLPLARDLATRTYRNTQTGRLYPVSPTVIISAVTKTPADLANIERHRPTWEPRGLTVHGCLEAWLKTRVRPSADDMGAYADWVGPLIDAPLWDRVDVVGIEHTVCDDGQNWAGTADMIVRYRKDGSYGIWDLKTKSRVGAARQDVKPQLGAYGRAAGDLFRLLMTRHLALWAYPGEMQPEGFEADTCHLAWLDVYERYQLAHRPF